MPAVRYLFFKVQSETIGGAAVSLATLEHNRMMLRVIPSIIVFVLLAAHFLRAGSPGLALVCVIAPMLLLIRRNWSLIAVQVLAYVAAAVWLYTLIELVQERIMLHRPWGKAAIILAAVILFTIFAGWLLNSSAVQAKYPSKYDADY